MQLPFRKQWNVCNMLNNLRYLLNFPVKLKHPPVEVLKSALQCYVRETVMVLSQHHAVAGIL